jgi:hypothetical protein
MTDGLTLTVIGIGVVLVLAGIGIGVVLVLAGIVRRLRADG